MNFWVLGTDFLLSPLEERALFSDFIRKGLEAGAWPLGESVFVSTCNRAELYAWSEMTLEQANAEILGSFSLGGSKSLRLRKLEGSQALRHLFRVVASLESMVVGETQITGQIRRSYEASAETGQVKTRMHRAFQEAFRIAKRVRSETEVGRFAVSVPSVGVKLAEKVFGNLSHRKVLVLGLGEIGRLAAEHFACIGPKTLGLYNRTQETAFKLKRDLDPHEVKIEILGEDYRSALPDFDVIVAAASVQLLDAKDMKKLACRSPQTFILDLGVPACVEQSEELDLFVYNIDDLKRIAEENSELRGQELQKAGRLIAAETERVWQRFEGAELGETLRLLAMKTEESRKKELESLRSRLNGVSGEDWIEIEKMSERLSSKILQDPIKELRTRLDYAEERETWLEFFRNIFRI